MKKEKRLTIVTIRSDGLDEAQIQCIKKQLKKALPKNHKIAVIGLSSNDGISVDTVRI